MEADTVPKNAVELTAPELIREAKLDPNSIEAGQLRRLLFVQRAFGSVEGAGAFDILHAWPFGNKTPQKPGFDNRNGFKPLLLDTVTVHHPAYYQQNVKKVKEGEPPVFARPSDIPVPVSCVSIRPGTGFVFGLRAGDEGLHTYVRGLLNATLRRGVGAKTAKGYGRFGDISAIN